MTIQHHLDDATLLAFAAGTLPPELSIVVSAHLDVCPRCRRELRLLDTLGAAFMEDLPAAELTRSPPAPAARTAEPPPASRARPSASVAGVPRTVATLLPASFEALAWKRLARGLWRYDVAVPGRDRGTSRGHVYLLKARPGVKIPEHTHEGGELTLVLEGAFTDASGRYGVGDVADLDDSIDHTPVADAEAGCICIVGEEGPPEFRGFAARVVQRLRPS